MAEKITFNPVRQGSILHVFPVPTFNIPYTYTTAWLALNLDRICVSGVMDVSGLLPQLVGRRIKFFDYSMKLEASLGKSVIAVAENLNIAFLGNANDVITLGKGQNLGGQIGIGLNNNLFFNASLILERSVALVNLDTTTWETDVTLTLEVV